ncbi:hypothetical protein JCM19000A_17610 [Silvimonas sp. JCM 19000]
MVDFLHEQTRKRRLFARLKQNLSKVRGELSKLEADLNQSLIDRYARRSTGLIRQKKTEETKATVETEQSD